MLKYLLKHGNATWFHRLSCNRYREKEGEFYKKYVLGDEDKVRFSDDHDLNPTQIKKKKSKNTRESKPSWT